MKVLRSHANERVRRWARLGRDARLRRREGCALIEGPHLVAAWLAHRFPVEALLISETGLTRPELAQISASAAIVPTVVADSLFDAIADAVAPSGLAAEIRIPARPVNLESSTACVFLDGIQDPGNIGTILRSAAAFGVQDAVLSVGCADAWGPKALRAGMGGQFSLRILEGADLLHEIPMFRGQIVCAVPRGGVQLDEIRPERRIAWIFGSEGAGVNPAVAALATTHATIPAAGAIESLNVAAAASICLYETVRILSTP